MSHPVYVLGGEDYMKNGSISDNIQKLIVYLFMSFMFFSFVISYYIEDFKYFLYVFIAFFVYKFKDRYKNYFVIYWAFIILSLIALLLSITYIDLLLLVEILYLPFYFIFFSVFRGIVNFEDLIYFVVLSKGIFYALFFILSAFTYTFLGFEGSWMVYYLLFLSILLTLLWFLMILGYAKYVFKGIEVNTNLSMRRIVLYAFIYAFALFLILLWII